MLDPGDHTAHQPTETLQVGSSRSSLSQKVPTQWRQPALVALVFAVGVAAGVAAVLGWQGPERAAPSEFHADEHAVELLLFAVAPGSGGESARISIDSAVVLSGAVTATVDGVQVGDPSIGVRIRSLPLTVSPTARFQSVTLEIVVKDCEAARRWVPTDRPFTITWQDEFGMSHLDRAGDFDRSLAPALVRSIRAVCGKTAP